MEQGERRPRPQGLLVAGTTSDAGKSVVVTGLCRSLQRRGVRVAPFKAQNMSNNSMVTVDGAEIGRAQWVQARAAKVEPEAAMNPVLLKPGSDRRSHVVLMGQPHGNLEAGEYLESRSRLAQAAFDAFDDLARRFDVVLCEGAGSPAEINLRQHDYVNMGLARHAGLPTLLVGDIDRGGVFAAMHGTLALLDADDQALVAGLVVNKFRGDAGLLTPGLRMLEEVTGRAVMGVLPWQQELWLDAEDSLALEARPAHEQSVGRPLRVAVVMLPRISNFTDVDALCLEPAVEVTFVREPRGLGDVDVVVLPGTRATLADLQWLRERGLADGVRAHASRGGVVLGICGGLQMLGSSVEDPQGVEGPAGARAEGLGLLDVATSFTPDKAVRLRQGEALGVRATGYEIHHGRVTVGDAEPFLEGARRGSVFGTMWHGCLEGDALRRAWLAEVAVLTGRKGLELGRVSFDSAREQRIDALADAVEQHLDVDEVVRLVEEGAPPGLPPVRGGLVR